MLSIVIPANNEQGYIGACLDSLLAQDIEVSAAGGIEVIVAANACTDRTVPIAQTRAPQFEARGWKLIVLDLLEGGKPNALNKGDAAACGDVRIYLDADVTCEPAMLSQLHEVLAESAPRYASGTLTVAPSQSWVSRRYGALWERLPFMTDPGVPGAGLFAVNAAGRARWQSFPGIISDDTYVRLQFTPAERFGVSARYFWPVVEGFNALVRVRRRQQAGDREIAERFPELMVNEGKPALGLAGHVRLMAVMPLSYIVYAGVLLAVRLGHGGQQAWTRGR